MSERTAELIAAKLEAMDTANGEHDARVALAMDTVERQLEALAMVRSPSAPAAYVVAYCDTMLAQVLA